jgi:hypothetical protein
MVDEREYLPWMSDFHVSFQGRRFRLELMR